MLGFIDFFFFFKVQIVDGLQQQQQQQKSALQKKTTRARVARVVCYRMLGCSTSPESVKNRLASSAPLRRGGSNFFFVFQFLFTFSGLSR